MPKKEPSNRRKLFNFQEWKSPYVAGWGVVALIICLSLMSLLVGYDKKLESWEHASAIIRNGFIVVGGVIGFVLAIVRVQQTDDQIVVAKTEANGREGERVRESFQQAVSMLYGEEDEIKPFAITQLRRIALDRPDLHLEQAISLLCGYARKNAPLPIYSHLPKNEKAFSLANECIDLVFELAVEFEIRKNRCAPIDLKDTFLKSRTIRGITFNANSIRRSELNDVRFVDCKFINHFPTDTSFYHVVFDNVSFEKTLFQGVSFEGAEFFSCCFNGAVWYRCNFGGAVLHDTKIDKRSVEMFSECNLSDCHFVFSDNLLANDGRDFLVEDFRKCYLYKGGRVQGLEKNAPPLTVSIDEELTQQRWGIVVSESDT